MIPAGLEPVRDQIQESRPASWREITVYDEMSPQAKHSAVKLNALGSLFYFSKVILGHSRLSPNLHGYMCRELERETLHIAMEIPRDHFKTTVASVSAPMWWGLPFTAEDEDLLYALGYSDEWIRWMRRAHSTSTRTMIASETIGNARKIGSKISMHYESNGLFRYFFPSILPKDSARWNQDSMTHNRLDGVYQGEGTFDLIGVRGALQSRHYDRQVIDDPVGEKAVDSDMVMESTIYCIKKLPGAFDTDPNRPDALADQLFIGNRWSKRDVGEWLRNNAPNFNFITHSAEGGCCELKNPDGTLFHPPHTPIFPEEFSMGKLADLRRIFTNYPYSCHFLNNPIDPEAVRFKTAWLRHYKLDVWKEPAVAPTIANWSQLSPLMRSSIQGGHGEDVAESHGVTPKRLKVAIHHEVQQGETIEDMRAGDLDRICLMDPNHSEERGRARNATLVIGVYNRPPKPRRIYLLDCWAKASSHEEWLDSALSVKPGSRGLALKWRCHYLYIESEVAGQQGWKFAIRERIKQIKEYTPTVRPLKTERSSNAKINRIIGVESIFENGFFWVPRVGCEDWIREFEEFPNGSTIDLLDLTGYLAQILGPGSKAAMREFISQEIQRSKIALQGLGNAGY